MLILLVGAAYATLFIAMPRWLSVLLSIAFLGAGVLCALFGAFGSYWDRQMTPGTSNGGGAMLIAGMLVLLPRVALIWRIAMEAFTAPPMP